MLEEFRKGFKYKQQLLRPAMVKVAVSTASSPSADSEDSQSDQKA
ncbi:MAG: nucleotide exchange factor GrpE [Akkermansiaceae bacterium]|nr:nucleotide exchange factor GrpE [Akkermansiaceae bacterium]